MDNTVLWVILLVAGMIVSYIGGKKVELRALCKELGEGFLALDEFLSKEDPTKEDAEKLRKEWWDVLKAGGALFGKVLQLVKRMRHQRGEGMRK